MASKSKTIQDQIYDLLNPAPSELHSDDDLDTQTKAKVVDAYDEQFEDDYGKESKTILRSHVTALDEDPRYTGKRISRKRIGLQSPKSKNGDIGITIKSRSFKSESGSEIEQSDEEQSSAEGRDEQEEDENSEGSYENGEEEEDDNDNTEGSGSEIDDDEEEDADNYDDIGASGENDNESFQHVSKKDIQLEVEKGNAVKSQISLWDNLLECRIHMQKVLINSNSLPAYDNMDLFKKSAGNEFSSLLKKNQTSLQSLLDKLLNMQNVLVNAFSETKNIQKKKQDSEDEASEEIPSDTEDEALSDTVIKSTEIEERPKKRRRLDEYEQLLNSNHTNYADYCYSTIEKWNERTRLITGKSSNRNFSGFALGIRKQTEQILSNRSRLIKRTQLKRSVTNILGESVSENPENTEKEDYNPEIFDDSDFYHQLLRELIERRSGESTDPSVLGKRWAMLQRLRVKMKRRIDTRATKGRRIRFDPHPKLVGFMAPIDRSTWTDQAKNELYSSLFGSKAQ